MESILNTKQHEQKGNIMGTIYYLLRPDNYTLFELGKSLVNGVFENSFTVPRPLPDHEALCSRIKMEVARRFAIDVDKDPEWRGYPEALAHRIIEWSEGRRVMFISEHQQESGWRITGDRYIDVQASQP